MSVRRIATIGVYGFDVSSFLAALRKADVGLLLDVEIVEALPRFSSDRRFLAELAG
jgi:hypothetical protein